MVKKYKKKTFYKKKNKMKLYKQPKSGIAHRKIEYDLAIYNVASSVSFNNAVQVFVAPVYQNVFNSDEFKRMAKLYQFFKVNGIKLTYQRSSVVNAVPFYAYVDFSCPFASTVDISTASRSDSRMSCATLGTNNENSKYYPCEKDVFVVDQASSTQPPLGIYGGNVWNECNTQWNNNSMAAVIIGQQIAGNAESVYGVIQVVVYLSYCKPVYYPGRLALAR